MNTLYQDRALNVHIVRQALHWFSLSELDGRSSYFRSSHPAADAPARNQFRYRNCPRAPYMKGGNVNDYVPEVFLHPPQRKTSCLRAFMRE